MIRRARYGDLFALSTSRWIWGVLRRVSRGWGNSEAFFCPAWSMPKLRPSSTPNPRSALYTAQNLGPRGKIEDNALLASGSGLSWIAPRTCQVVNTRQQAINLRHPI